MEKLDFGLDESIPKYWFGGDPFRTRFFDAMSLIFPPRREVLHGDRARLPRSGARPRKLLQDIKDFNRQEAQHSMVHNQYNELLRKQGMPVDEMIGWLRQPAVHQVPQPLQPPVHPGHHRRAGAPDGLGCARHVRRARHPG